MIFAEVVEEIAEKSEVSRRSIFRFFNSKEEWLYEVNNLMYKRVNDLFSFPKQDPRRSLEETVKLFLDLFVQVNEYIMPLRKIAEGRKNENTLIRDIMKKNRQIEIQYISNLFDPYLKGTLEKSVILHLLHLNSSWNTWAVLRLDYNLGIKKSRKLLEKQIAAFLSEYLKRQ